MRIIGGLFFTALFIVCSFGLLHAQSKATLSGYVKDAQSGETLTGASLYVVEKEDGVVTNPYGFYSLTLPAGSYRILIRYAGYTTLDQTVNLVGNREMDFELVRDQHELKAVSISGEAPDQNVEEAQMGKTRLEIGEIKKMPVLFGEVDVLKTLQLLPGVQGAGEGNSGFYVRGGGADQNLVLLDNATIYNTGHLFGFFSVFNGDALKNVTLIKGVTPANYGGRLSSVVDVEMKDGNKKEFHGTGGIGLISSRLTLEGPIKKDKSSFMVSARRTYADLLIKPFLKDESKGSGYYFYDINLKADWILGAKDHLFLSGYFGKDVFTFHSRAGTFNLHMPWGNATTTIRWNHQFSPKLFLNTTGIYNDYRFRFRGSQNDLEMGIRSSIRDWNGKLDFDYYPGLAHHIQFGAELINHKFVPNQVSGQSADTVFTGANPFSKYADELGLYALDEFSIGSNLKINAGIRFSWFAQIGPYNDYVLDENLNPIDSTVYRKGKLVTGYPGWEPRITARLQVDEHSSFKIGVGRNYQYLTQVSNNGSTLPTDVWVPSTKRVKPQIAWQYSLGYFRNFMDNQLETSIELYYKDMQNQVEYRSGYTPVTMRDPELDFVFGKGWAYGAEFFVRKTKGRFTGWISYTLAWSWRRFAQLNEGKKFPSKYDRRQDLSVTGSYDFNKKLSLSAVFVFATGNAITMPSSYYFIENSLVEDFSEINAYRIFPYHRLDLSLTYTPHPEKQRRWKGSWNFAIYNVYNRKNPYLLYVDTKGTLAQGSEVSVKQVSIFPIIPSITYNFKF